MRNCSRDDSERSSFFYGFSSLRVEREKEKLSPLRSFHEHVLFLPRLAGDRPFSLTRSARVVNVIRDRSRNAVTSFFFSYGRRIFSSAADYSVMDDSSVSVVY